MTNSTKQHRLFYALWPDKSTAESLLRLQAPLHGRKTHRDDFHITLAFLGVQPSDALPVLQTILMRLPRVETTLVLDRLAYSHRNRIAWLEMQAPPPALIELQDALAQELANNGIPFDRQRTFTPHITLARKADAPGELPFAPIIWHANRITLVQSLATDEGAKYRMLFSQ